MNLELIIFGTDQSSIAAYNNLTDWGFKIECFVDNDRKKQGTIINGKQCISFNDLCDKFSSNSLILVSQKNNIDIIKNLEEKNFKNIIALKGLSVSNFIKPLKYLEDDYNDVHPFGHYESPYPDLNEIHLKEKEIFDNSKETLDIDFNEERQLQLLKYMALLDKPDWKETSSENYKYRYILGNVWFYFGSAIALYSMLRILKPKNFIEVGSGYSSAVTLDTNEYYLNNTVKFSAIEPNPERLKSLLKPTDNIQLLECGLQEVPLNYFSELGENDILFIDSSHVSKINSDVNYLFFEILPRLHKGVYIHFHDIFYPFIYPSRWIYEGRAYNEMYMLRAFLMNNKNYSIQLFGDMITKKYGNIIDEKVREYGEGSIWIKKET